MSKIKEWFKPKVEVEDTSKPKDKDGFYIDINNNVRDKYENIVGYVTFNQCISGGINEFHFLSQR